MSTPPVATATGLTKRYGATVALDSGDLELYPGVTGLLGPKGAGKTTLVRMLTTSTSPTAGRIRR